jgi:KDO2-lipid IV(A) lauroyltransferase
VAFSRLLAAIYWHMARHRRLVVVHNLVPALGGNIPRAEQVARRLFANFAHKLIDLWRYEGGLPIGDVLGGYSGWEHFLEAQRQCRGILLVTPHVGNWEFGGPWLNRMGVKLRVITLAEPGSDFTEIRQAARARWNIETTVIGNDPFAFVEIIRKLDAGATVALLIDRPSPATAIPVELFGRPFSASVAAAELARAAGCALLPVYVARSDGRYSAHILPEIKYERGDLRAREARIALTQQIVQVFEPVLLEHLDQWYNFVPIWPAANGLNSESAFDI